MGTEASRADHTGGPARFEGTALLLATLGVCLACMVFLAWRRAGWLDEYWTVWHGDPVVPFRQAYWGRWLRDTQHPPTFYFLGWLLAPLTGPTLVARRLAENSLALLMIVPTAFLCLRRGRDARQPLFYALAVASNPYFIFYFAENRSYFSALTAMACLVAVVRQLHIEGAPGSRPRLPLAAWFCALALVANNLHYTMTLCALTLLGCACLHSWFRGSRRVAILIAAATLVALVPLGINLWRALHLARPVAVVAEGLARGWATILFMLAVGAVANLVLLGAAAAEMRGIARARRTAPGGGRAGFLIVLAASILLLAIGFGAMHAISRNILPRLLLGLIPLVAAAVCELAAWRGLSRRWLALACANAAVVAMAATLVQLRNPRWEWAVPAIVGTVRACPGTRVYAYDALYLTPADAALRSMTGQAQAIALSYRMIARKHGFAVTVLPERPVATPLAGDCPTLVWLEHNFFRPGLGAADVYRIAGLPAGAVPASALTLERGGPHFLLRVPAMKPAR